MGEGGSEKAHLPEPRCAGMGASARESPGRVSSGEPPPGTFQGHEGLLHRPLAPDASFQLVGPGELRGRLWSAVQCSELEGGPPGSSRILPELTVSPSANPARLRVPNLSGQ